LAHETIEPRNRFDVARSKEAADPEVRTEVRIDRVLESKANRLDGGIIRVAEFVTKGLA
jgi:CRISPR/Cas system CSM-associated protein Csm3 (group 7 of RAMP superfamily)